MRKFNYEYTTLKENQTSQYLDVDFAIGEPTDAIYVKSPIETDNGNPFIEALPKPRLNEEVAKDYELGLNISSRPKDEFTSLSEISLLKTLRFKLPFHQKMELEMYNCLVNSYRAREFIIGCNNTSKVIGNVCDAATDGFNILGESGSGKSSALKILLSRYPQVINHHLDGIGDFKQIVYLVVSTAPNMNFNALYISIAKAIDNALGFTEPFFELRLQKRTSLGEKTMIIESLIEKFNIGMILIDEIQLMSFSTAKENSYTSLAKLSNDTKVSIATIGLPEAMNQMFTQEWTARRLGSTIQADLYCENYEYFEMNLSKLLKYNWLEYPIEVTEEGKKTLFAQTNGAIAHLISFYMRVQLNNIGKDKKVELTKEYVEEIMNKYFCGLVKLLTSRKGKTCKDIQEKEIERLRIINEANLAFDAEINKKMQEAEMHKQIIEEQIKESNIKNAELAQFVLNMIKIFDPLQDEQNIIKSLNEIIASSSKKNINLSNEQALALTLEKLKQPKTHPRKSNNNPQQVNRITA